MPRPNLYVLPEQHEWLKQHAKAATERHGHQVTCSAVLQAVLHHVREQETLELELEGEDFFPESPR